MFNIKAVIANLHSSVAAIQESQELQRQHQDELSCTLALIQQQLCDGEKNSNTRQFQITEKMAAHLNETRELIKAIESRANGIDLRAKSFDNYLQAIEGNLDALAEAVKSAQIQQNAAINHVSTKLAETTQNLHLVRSEILANMASLAAKADQFEEICRRFDELNSRLPTGPVHDRFAGLEQDQSFLKDNIDVALLMYLRTFLTTNIAVDVGANVGGVSAALLRAGFEVFAIEPDPQTFEKLSNRLSTTPQFHGLNIAVSDSTGSMPLHKVSIDEGARLAFHSDPSVYSTLVDHPLPSALRYDRSIEVAVDTLNNLRASGQLPEKISLLKIDTEGNDLAVINGMGSNTYEVVMAEFWDVDHYFSGGKIGLLRTMVQAMRKRGYAWHIVLYRVFDGMTSTAPRFFCNFEESAKDSWGNVLFFQDAQLFMQAYRWCSATIPECMVYA